MVIFPVEGLIEPDLTFLGDAQSSGLRFEGVRSCTSLPRIRAPLGARRGECYSSLIRRGGAPSGAAALLAHGGMGAKPPSSRSVPGTLYIRTATRTFL